MTTHRRKLRNYLLDARYQLTYTLVMVFIASALTAGLGYFWYDEMRKASRIVEVKALASMTEAEVQQVQDDLAQQDRFRLLILVAFGLAFSLLLAGYGIVMTHRVAGPLHKITRHMTDIKEGRLYPLWGLRKGDQLQDFWDAFAGMHAALRDQSEREISLIDRSIDAVEQHLASQAQSGGQAEQLSTQLDALRNLRTEKVRSLEDASARTQQIDRE